MKLRPALPGDELSVARIHVRAWQAGYHGLLPAAYLESLRPGDRAARYTFGRDDGPRTTVAIDEGASGRSSGGSRADPEGSPIVGFATIQGAELCALHVAPDCWRRGVGRALIERARADLAAAGIAEAHVWVLVGNERALRFYERDGWTSDGARRSDTVWGATVDELQLRRRL